MLKEKNITSDKSEQGNGAELTTMNKINIAEIIKNFPQGTKLYSPLFGKVEFYGIEVDVSSTIFVTDENKVLRDFSKEGHYCLGYTNAECLLFPSSEMRDWRRFFKKGDVLYSPILEMFAIFDSWYREDYTCFDASIIHNLMTNRRIKGIACSTSDFFLAESCTEEVITKAKTLFGAEFRSDARQVEISNTVKTTYSFKPFDKVLVRDDDTHEWKINIFSHYDSSDAKMPFVCLDCCFKQCIPYNEHTAHLLGTTNAYEEGGEK